jgi:hypothetical protein
MYIKVLAYLSFTIEENNFTGSFLGEAELFRKSCLAKQLQLHAWLREQNEKEL